VHRGDRSANGDVAELNHFRLGARYYDNNSGGAIVPGETGYLDGSFAAVLVYEGNLSDADRQTIEEYLQRTYVDFDSDGEIVVLPPNSDPADDGVGQVLVGVGPPGAPTLTRTFRIRNDGTGILSGLGVTKSGAEQAAFVVDTTGMSAILAPGASTSFTVTFTPSTDGLHEAALHIASNDADENPFDLAVIGLGQASVQPVQEAYLKASNTDGGDNFGNAVAVWGDTVVVGAHWEESAAPGVNGDDSDNSLHRAGAVYVYVQDGGAWTQQAYLKAPDVTTGPGTGDKFWFSVGISGDTIVVGAHHEDSNATGVNGDPSDNSLSETGAAYVFVRSGTTWTQQAYLKASTQTLAVPGRLFGASVAIDGDTIVVGAPQDSSGATTVNGPEDNIDEITSGAAHVFVRRGTTWSKEAYLKPFNTGGRPVGATWGDRFGDSVSVQGDTVVIGAPYEDSNALGVNGDGADNSASNSGAAYVFVRNGTTWTQEAYLKASNTDEGDKFGWAVTVDENTIAVTSREEKSRETGVNPQENDNSGNPSGAAYVFTRSGTTWTQEAYIKGPHAQLGSSIDLWGNSLIIGNDRNFFPSGGIDTLDLFIPPYTNRGSAYLYTRTGTSWRLASYLKASDTSSNSGGDQFGKSVGIHGCTSVVGAWREDSNATGINGDDSNNSLFDPGAAYVFEGLGAIPAREIVVLDGGDDWRFPTGVEFMDGQASPFDFGLTPHGTPLFRDIVIVNLGWDDLTISDITPPTNYAILDPPTEPIPSWGRNYFTLRLHDNTTGVFPGDVVITSDDPDEGSFELPVTGEVFDDELEVWFINAGLVADQDPLATPHDDGTNNLLKYAFNMDGSGPDFTVMTPGTGTEGLPFMEVTGSGASSILRMEFVRRVDSGVTYDPQKSFDLAVWDPLTDTPTIVPINANWERAVYEEPFDASIITHIFGRVGATLP